MARYNLHFQIAGKLLRDKESHYSKPIVNLSIAGVALGIVIMIVAIAITGGYKKEIREKVIGMGSHIRISNYDNNYSFEAVPFERNQPFIDDLKNNPEIKNIQYFSTKVGIIKTPDQVEGIILKGIDQTFYWKDFQKIIIKGNKIDVTGTTASREILISSKLSKKIKIEVGDKVMTYFIQDPPMQRSFTVSGIFETGLPAFDEQFAIVDIRHVQKLNQWDSNMVGGIEILIHNYDKLDETGYNVNNVIDYKLKAETIKQIYPEIFEWIALFDTNVLVLLIITLFVCSITMMSTFFIVVLEQTQTIGILKTIGLKNTQIMSIFMMVSGKILLKGMLIGNAVALAFCLIQQYWKIVKLDPATYYVAFIPIEINPVSIIGINVGVFIICLLVLTLPAYFVARKITPVTAIRFD